MSISCEDTLGRSETLDAPIHSSLLGLITEVTCLKEKDLKRDASVQLRIVNDGQGNAEQLPPWRAKMTQELQLSIQKAVFQVIDHLRAEDANQCVGFQGLVDVAGNQAPDEDVQDEHMLDGAWLANEGATKVVVKGLDAELVGDGVGLKARLSPLGAGVWMIVIFEEEFLGDLVVKPDGTLMLQWSDGQTWERQKEGTVDLDEWRNQIIQWASPIKAQNESDDSDFDDPKMTDFLQICRPWPSQSRKAQKESDEKESDDDSEETAPKSSHGSETDSSATINSQVLEAFGKSLFRQVSDGSTLLDSTNFSRQVTSEGSSFSFGEAEGIERDIADPIANKDAECSVLLTNE